MKTQNKILPTTSLDDAIRRIAAGDIGAGTVIALLNKERPENIMAYLRSLDEKGLYGRAVYEVFFNDCGGELERFVVSISR